MKCSWKKKKKKKESKPSRVYPQSADAQLKCPCPGEAKTDQPFLSSLQVPMITQEGQPAFQVVRNADIQMQAGEEKTQEADLGSLALTASHASFPVGTRN